MNTSDVPCPHVPILTIGLAEKAEASATGTVIFEPPQVILSELLIPAVVVVVTEPPPL